MDWTEDADLHKQFKDRREETELLLDKVLSNIRKSGNQARSLSVYGLERKQETYLNTVDKDKKDSLKTILDTLKDWTQTQI